MVDSHSPTPHNPYAAAESFCRTATPIPSRPSQEGGLNGYVGSAIHLPFHELELVDAPFHRSSAPRQAQCRRDGGVVAIDAVGKTAQLTAARRGDPSIEGVDRVLPDHGAEGPSNADGFGDLRRGIDQRGHQLALGFVELGLLG